MSEEEPRFPEKDNNVHPRKIVLDIDSSKEGLVRLLNLFQEARDKGEPFTIGGLEVSQISVIPEENKTIQQDFSQHTSKDPEES